MTIFKETTDTENYRWIDCRFDMNDGEAGRKSYKQDHVKGAVHWDLDQDLSDMSSSAGRHPMPSKEQLTELVRKSGLEPSDQVIIYDQGGSPYAARAFFLLQYAGFPNIWISRFGFEELKRRGIQTESGTAEMEATAVKLHFNEEIYAEQTYVKKIVDGEIASTLLDARSEERYRGQKEPIDRVPGRIPGARNFDWTQLVEEGVFKETPSLLQTVLPHEPVVVYCGSGVTAAPLYALLKDAGHENVRLYTGSYSDWISDDTNAVEFDLPDHPEAADDETKAILGQLIAEGYTGEMLMKKFEYEKSLLNKK